MSTPAQPDEKTDVSYGRGMMLRAVEKEVGEIEERWFSGIETLDEWEARRIQLRQELAEMVGLSPLPSRTDLRVEITNTLDHPEFTVHNLHFQSLPGLYVTANYYVPKKITEPVPAVLYLCGHASGVEEGVAVGNKTAYQRHPAWYARHGIASLVIDTLDRGEVPGLHHGTYSQGRWWWYNRGYTPAGVEVWNAMRALDFLETRSEVDMRRLGATGRSGGGMYSWLLLALDDRISVATPTAGMTDLRDHVVNGVIRGHCDCNYWNNYYRLDPTVMAALAAPRPVMLVNTDADPIFPLSGIRRIDERVQKVYALYGQEERWRTFIGSGGHEETRELQVATLSWMHRWLKGTEITEIPEVTAFFERRQFKVLEEIPADQINDRIDEMFAAEVVSVPVPDNRRRWTRMKEAWMAELQAKPFAGWPEKGATASSLRLVQREELEDLRLEAYEFSSEEEIDLRLWVLRRRGAESEQLSVRVLDDAGWREWFGAVRSMAAEQWEGFIGSGARAVSLPEPNAAAVAGFRSRILDTGESLVFLAPRGVGPTAFEEHQPNRGDTVTRSLPMLGQTVDGMRVWDVRQALTALRSQAAFGRRAVKVEAAGAMAAVVLYASLFGEPVDELRLTNVPDTHRDGPYLLNIDQILGIPQLVAMARDRAEIWLDETSSEAAAWSDELRERLGTSDTPTEPHRSPLREKRNEGL